jgi:hypothetical protein
MLGGSLKCKIQNAKLNCKMSIEHRWQGINRKPTLFIHKMVPLMSESLLFEN